MSSQRVLSAYFYNPRAPIQYLSYQSLLGTCTVSTPRPDESLCPYRWIRVPLFLSELCSPSCSPPSSSHLPSSHMWALLFSLGPFSLIELHKGSWKGSLEKESTIFVHLKESTIFVHLHCITNNNITLADHVTSQLLRMTLTCIPSA